MVRASEQTTVFIIMAFPFFLSSAQNPVVSTSSGRVRGFSSSVLNKEIDIFMGIPFAKPPVGYLRFQRPHEVDRWTDVREAIVPPPSCHVVMDTSFESHPAAYVWNPTTNMSEDCLYLNIWTPKNSTGRKLATLVWIFGGGYFAGSTMLDWYDGKFLAAENDVIVVSVNYRIGPLGFLYLGTDEAPGNMGLLDQQIALKWIYENIESFGGDKQKITLFGESAGASSVHYHMLAVGSRPYFTNAIFESSSALSPWAYHTNSKAKSNSRTLAEALGCPVLDANQILLCINQSDAATITEKQWSVLGTFIYAPFAPTNDNYFIDDSPENLMKDKKVKNNSVLVGVNKDEGFFFMIYGTTIYYPYTLKPFSALAYATPLTRSDFLSIIPELVPVRNGYVQTAILHEYEYSEVQAERQTYEDILDEIGGDHAFKCPTLNFARDYLSIYERNVYVYSYEHFSTGNLWPRWMGVGHGYEIDLVFGIPLDNRQNYTEEEKDLSRKMMTYWTNFAKTGDPNQNSLSSQSPQTWPAYSTDAEEYIILKTGTTLSTGTALRYRQCRFWRDVIPDLEKLDITDPGTCVGSSTDLRPSAMFLSLIVLQYFL